MKRTVFLILFLAFTAACEVPLGGGPSAEQQATITATVATAIAAVWTKTSTPTDTPTFTPTPTDMPTPTSTFTPTETPTPTITPSLTITPTPTFAFPSVVVNKQAHCRYGPSQAYLHAADLYAGDTGSVHGRYPNSTWLLIKFDKLTYSCWVAPSVVDVKGDIKTVRYTEPRLPGPSVLYGEPQRVAASRQGDQVTVTWSVVDMTLDDDRGYMLDVWVCQNGELLWWPVGLSDKYQTSYTFTDQAGCAWTSGGKLAAVEKHGYTTWVTIPWPAP
jgi:hypothetical protein